MTEFINLFEACGKEFLPGRKPLLGGPLPPITPVSFDPQPPDVLATPGIVTRPFPTGQPLFKCVDTPIPCPEPFQGTIKQTLRSCQPCLDVNGNPIISLIRGPASNPECKYFVPTCDDFPGQPCEDSPIIPCPQEPDRYKCVEEIIECPTGFESNHPDGSNIQQIIRNCVLCLGAANNDPDCVYSDPNCTTGFPGAPTVDICETGAVYTCSPVGPGGGGGGTNPGTKCVTTTLLCPAGTSKAGTVIGVLSRECKECEPLGGPASPPISLPGKALAKAPAQLITETGCSYADPGACTPNCPPAGPITGYSNGQLATMDSFCNEAPVLSQVPALPNEPGGGTGGTGGGGLGACCLPGGGGCILLDQSFCAMAGGTYQGAGTGINDPSYAVAGGLCQIDPCPGAAAFMVNTNPLASVTLPADQLLKLQEKNSVVIDTNTKLIEEDFSILSNRQTAQKIYDKELNFFELEPDPTRLIANDQYLEIFNDKIDVSIDRALRLGSTSASWSEDNFFNITANKIEVSLNSDLLTAFKILRHPGGEVVGLEVLLQMVKKHIVTGTLSQLDAQFYIDVGKAQLQQNFVLLSDAKNEDYAVRGSINYIIENGESVVPRKDTERKSIEANRGRHLNEDLGLKIPVETTLSGTKFLAIPNQGIALSALNPKTSKTDKSIGSSDLLNIGDGGGYYIAVSSPTGDFPLKTTNLVDSSYYLPDFKKAKVLSLNGKTFISTITASALPNKNEFIAGDLGASSFEPMYFVLNLDTVSSTYSDNPLIEVYNATYSRIVDTDQISRHVNNNAKALSEFRIGYDDPIYRYILDTSSFELEQQDFTVYGFKGASAVTSYNFPRNIPFAVVVRPVAGSKLNPLNGQSPLLNYSSEYQRRSLKFKPSISNIIDGTPDSGLEVYNLYNEDRTQRIGLVEDPSVQSFGYKFNSASYQDSLYDGDTYTSSIEAVSSQGSAFLLRDVIDFIAEKEGPKTVTWFDLYRRMPFNRFSELFYTLTPELVEDIKKGFRGGVRPDYVTQSTDDTAQSDVLLEEDEKVIIQVSDRDSIKQKEDSVPVDSDTDPGIPADEGGDGG